MSGIFAAVTILILSIFMVSRGREWVEAFLALQPPDREARLRRALDRSATAVGPTSRECCYRRRSPA